MVVVYELKDFLPFVHFIVNQDNKLLSPPVNGQLWVIRPLLQEFHKSGKLFTTHEEFIDYVAQFNPISGYLLMFDGELDNEHPPRLIWINMVGILMLKTRLEEGKMTFPRLNEPKGLAPASILDLLETHKPAKSPFYTHEKIIESSFMIDKEAIHEMINRTTSRTILNKQKAKLVTTEVPFYEVCNEYNHNQILATLGLNKKEYSHFGSKQSIPEDLIVQRILKCKNIISNEIFNCFKEKIHFLPIINNHTDLNLGDCSYLDTCHKMKTCRYLHYYTLNPMVKKENEDEAAKSGSAADLQLKSLEYTIGDCFTESFREVLPPQWINCDVRHLPFSILGKFSAIISDPAWDIHMSLPYGTCKDDELLSLPMEELQDEGIIMLWVTGRSIEVGRRALIKWGYKIYDEMIWIKLNQLRRTIVTGRTGHWLNHSKEHLLVGLKGDPIWINKQIDTDVVVSPTRETSRKPDEFYDIVERLVGKHSRKLEIFGRDHNTRPGWLTIGNQLQGVSLYEPELKYKYDLYKQQQQIQEGGVETALENT
ncbi:N6-adenosine-methyltransferase IME4 [Candida viswanathii]|uniref:mRNA m(6)A methyltransferase n=1 Tax=Candida viswanathii TaxID=5486 RepID=A0A367YNA5_9ASCO|nr:N6-adenosine-methyltransferase IME4 [Candida viswanathii]